MTGTGNIPDELIRFFKTGRILLVKGDAGTGKTTLACEILRCIDPASCIYFSARAPPNLLLEHYPWLEGKVLLGPEEIRFLETSQESPERLLQRLREQLLRMENPFLVLDSWDAVASEMEPKERVRMGRAIAMTTYTTDGRTIIIVESDTRTFLDFMADGVVSLAYTDVHGEAEPGRVYEERLERRTGREIEFRKLRGLEIRNKRYPFTLKNGNFRFFGTFYEDLSIRPVPVQDLADDRISSGIADLDEITGGFRRGSFNLMEVEHGVDKRYLQIHTQIAWNAAANRKGVVIVPSIGEVYPPELLQEVVLRPVRADDRADEITSMMENAKRGIDPKRLANGLVMFLGFDTLENQFGSDGTLVAAEMIINYGQQNGVVIIATIKRGTRILERIAHMSERHLVFKDFNNALVLYGMRPKTGLYAVDVASEKVRLMPIV